MWIWLFIHEDSSRGVGFSTFQKLMHEPERAHTARHRQHAAEHQCWSGMTVITHARWNSRRRGYCVQTRLSVCLSVCPRSNRKTAWAINTKLGTRILYSSRSACTDPTQHGYENRSVASDHARYSEHLHATVLPAAVGGVDLHVDTTAYVF